MLCSGRLIKRTLYIQEHFKYKGFQNMFIKLGPLGRFPFDEKFWLEFCGISSFEKKSIFWTFRGQPCEVDFCVPEISA